MKLHEIFYILLITFVPFISIYGEGKESIEIRGLTNQQLDNAKVQAALAAYREVVLSSELFKSEVRNKKTGELVFDITKECYDTHPDSILTDMMDAFNKCSDLQTAISAAEGDVLEEKIQAIDAERAKVAEAIKMINKEENEVTLDNEKLFADLDLADKELATLTAGIKTLSESLDMEKASNKEKLKHYESLVETNNLLKKSLAQKEAEIVEMQKRIAELTIKDEVLALSLKRLQDENENLELLKSELEQRTEVLKFLINSLNQIQKDKIPK